MALPVTEYLVRLKLTEPMLGTVPKLKNVYTDFVTNKAPGVEKVEDNIVFFSADATPEEADAVLDEIATVPEEPSGRGWTGFHTDADGKAFIYDYQVKGFFKEAGNTLKDFAGPERTKLQALRSKLDSYMFITPRRIYLNAILEEPLERPLRAMTMQGPRVTLVKSDVCPAGTELVFTLKLLPHRDLTEDVLRLLLDYGEFLGLGQWRTGSYGRFTYELSKVGS